MTGLLLGLLGSTGLLVLLAVGVFFLFGPTVLLGLLRNKYVLGALGIGLLLWLACAWRQHDMDTLRAEGAAAIVAADAKALGERRAAIADWVVSHAQRDSEARDKQRLAEQRLDLQAGDRQKDSHVSARAVAACPLTVGFVYDHNRAVPGAGGRATVPPSPAASEQPSGVALTAVTTTIDHNYTQCAKLVERIDAAEAKRYADCLAWDAKYGTSSGCTK